MRSFRQLLAPIRSQSEAETVAPLGQWLASRLHCRLTFLVAAAHTDIAGIAEWLSGTLSQPLKEQVSVQTSPGDYVEESLRASRTKGLDLLVLPFAGGDYGTEAELVASEVSRVIERSPVPVLLVPPPTTTTAEPWTSILVPMSGEIRENYALRLGLELAAALAIPVDVLHVACCDAARTAVPPIINRLVDQPQHELPRLIEEFITEAAPFAGIEEKRSIRDFQIVQGDVKTRILQHIETRRSGLVMIQWNGKFMTGRAMTLKSMMRETKRPVLLVRAETPGQTQLTAGRKLAS